MGSESRVVLPYRSEGKHCADGTVLHLDDGDHTNLPM